MDRKKEIVKKLEKAIDAMDMQKIDAQLEKLKVLSETQISPEEPTLFSARVKALQKEKINMKKPSKLATAGILAAAIVVLSVSVAASGVLKRFTFTKDDTLTTVHTTEAITEAEAKALTDPVETPTDVELGKVDTQNLSFETAAEAEAGMGIKLPLPEIASSFSLNSATGSILTYGNDLETRSVWLDYSDENSRKLGVTVTKEIIKDGADVTGVTSHDMDSDSLGSYTTPDGTKYTTLTESDPSNKENIAFISKTTVGNYEYAVVFFGFDQGQREEAMDGIDLSVLY